MEVRAPETDAEIDACWPVMVQLRPHLPREQFVARVRDQMQTGYRLVAAVDGGEVRAAAGFRCGTSLAWDRFLYVDDLVTDAAVRGRGYGHALFEWLVGAARAAGCTQLHLDSGVQRFEAHRFYLQQRLRIASHHFRLLLTEREA